MRFRILGSLEVVEDAGEPVTIAGRHHPRLLGLLLLGANRVLTADRAVEVLWGDAPPATAARQVQNIAGTLRRRLGAGSLERVGGGYRLNVADDRLDAAMFTAAVTEARGHRERGDATAAWRALDAGLSVWRGPVLAGLSGLSHLTARLEQERLSAMEERAELSLVLGSAESEIPRLRELSGEHPLRQSLVGVLMRALHQTGRTAEALDVYNECRTRLADELGIDPGRRLRDLYTAILRDEPAPVESVPAATVSDAPAAPIVPRPAQLPHPPGRFVGRAAELAILDTLPHRPGGAVAAITGQGGVGKTALALHWAHRHAAEFPDGQLYLNLRGFDDRPTMTVREALSRLLVSLGVPGDAVPSEVGEADALLRSTLADRRTLIVLDNARDAEAVRPLLPGIGRNLVLVTSRDPLAGLVALNDAVSVPLKVLDVEECRTLLTRLLPGPESDSIADLDLIARLCNRLPLAVRIAAANLMSRAAGSMDDFLTELSGAGRLDVLAVPGDSAAAVARSIDLSFTSLHEQERRLLVRLARVPGEDFARGLVLALVDDPQPEVVAAMRRLTDLGLVECHQEGRFGLHDLVRHFLLSRAVADMGPEKEADVVARVRGWYVDPSHYEYADEFENFMAMVTAYAGEPGLWRTLEALQGFVSLGYDALRIRACAEIGLARAVEEDDVLGQAVMLDYIAVTHAYQGDAASAVQYGRRALDLALASGDAIRAGDVLCNFGQYQFRNGNFVEAEDALIRAVEVSRRHGPDWELGIRLSMVGTLYRRTGRLHAAEQCVTESLKVFSAVESPQDAGEMDNARDVLVATYIDLGRFEEGAALIERVLSSVNRSDRRKLPLSLARRAELKWRDGDLIGAHRDVTAALAALEDSGHLVDLRFAQFRAAAILSDMGRQREALRHLRIGGLDEEHENKLDRAERDRLSCVVLARMGDVEGAVRHGHRAVALYAEMGAALDLARARRDLGVALGLQGDDDAAHEMLDHAWAAFRYLGVPEVSEPRPLLGNRA